MEKKRRKQSKTLRYNKKISVSSSPLVMFKKHFEISNTQKDTQIYTLPKPGSIFTESPWQLSQLQEIKKELNHVKSELNDFDLLQWQLHTKRMNKAGDIVRTVKDNIQAEFVTQAWCKFYEITSNYYLVSLNKIYERDDKSFKSVHLCEAPGAFITALNHWLKINAPDVQWNWLATTLNPYCEGNSYNNMVADDRFIRHTLDHWYFGDDNTGNIMDLKNLDALVKKAKSLDGKRILLVTADGSIDCTDVPGEQETTVAQLHLCETVACMHLLEKGGNFLLKVFTLFEHQSICLMYLLSCAFHQVSVTKPASSKGGNSEIYVVCMNFKGEDYIASYLPVLRHYYGSVPPVNAMFSLRDIPDNFLQKIKDCSEFFKHHQIKIIEDNIKTFNFAKNFLSMSNHKELVSSIYLENCKLNKIDRENEIVGREVIERNNNYFVNKKLHVDSYNDRCKEQDLEPQERLLQLWNNVKEIEWPLEKVYIWHLRVLPETLEIQTGKAFNKIYNSRFCDSRILQTLIKIDNIIQDNVCFPPAEVAKDPAQQIEANHEILNFQFIQDYNSHRIIAEIYDRLEKLQSEKTFIFIGYPLLTQLNIGLVCLLGNLFNKILIEVHDTEGYRIKLETYQRDAKTLSYLREILNASYNAHHKDMAIWSIVPMTVLYEYHQLSTVMSLNHLMIKLYARHVINMMYDKNL